ncbi:acid protease [Rhizodiscina lignyota]|uniref:Acid protease n=1 Tax=Rhizodiscina lignyota TaxID=1504668 RepID=A0A9P4IC20_9PEZI|nr:acid protease [Rhizodiscina lignyota]
MFLSELVALSALFSFVLGSHPKISLRAKSKSEKVARRDVNGAGNVTLANYFNGTDLQWYGAIGVGTPPQNLTVVFDSASTDLLIPSVACSPSNGCPSEGIEGPLHKFNQNSSSTFHTQNKGFYAPFGTGIGVAPSDFESQTGIIATDTVCVSGLCAKNQTMGLVMNETAGFANDPFDGILGLAFPALGVTGNGSFFNSLVQAKAVAEALYGFYLTPNVVGGAELTLGGIDESKIESNITYAKVAPPFWNVTFDDLTVNGVSVNLTYKQALFDTGTSNVVGGDISQLQEIYGIISPKIKLIDKNGAFGMPCSEIQEIVEANVKFTISGKTFMIPTPELFVGEYPSLPGVCQAFWNADVTNSYGGAFIVGASLLKYYYSVWDFGNSRFGLADTDISPPRVSDADQ